MTRTAIDLFAGCGGATTGLIAAGYNVTALEVWDDACRSHVAAHPNHPTYKGDIAAIDPNPTAGWFDHLHASPPCTTFSAAGKGKGRHHLDDLAAAVKRVLHGEPHGLDDIDETTLLTLEPARWIAAHRPHTISFEQVRAVLPVWQAYADALADLGYSAWVGVLNAEQYGLPQARARAWLIARRDGKEAGPPTPTHSRYHSQTPDRLDDGVARWVTMADALGYSADTVAGFPRRADSDDTVTIDGVDYRARDLRDAEKPASVITEKARSWQVLKAGNSQFNKPTSRRLSVEEALVLQGFPADYPLHGSKTSQFKQVGNAVPPPVMQAVAEALAAVSVEVTR